MRIRRDPFAHSGFPLSHALVLQPFEHDVQLRTPDVSKAKRLLDFEATTPLEAILDEVIPWITEQVEQGKI